jgi:flagellar basal body-associated protein FliL
VGEEHTEEAAPPEGRGGVLHLVRWILALLACVLAVVAVTGAVAAYYARLELLDTDRFTERTANIAEDEQVQQGIAALTTREIEKALDVEQIAAQANSWIGSETAPALVEDLVASAVETLQGYIENEVNAFVASPQFLEVWDAAVREAHSSLVSALEGDNAGSIQAEGTTLTLDLGKIVAIVKERMVESDVALAEDIPAVEADYVLVDSEQVPELQRTVDRLDWAADWLPWIALGLLVIAFVLIPRRWVAALVVGVLGVVLAGVALWSIGEGKTLFVARARDAAFAPVTYDAFTDQLKATYVVMLVIALVLALVAVGALFLRRKRADA